MSEQRADGWRPELRAPRRFTARVHGILHDDGGGPGAADSAAAQIARAIADEPRSPCCVWLEFQDCAGNTESFLRASRPTAAEVVLDVLSVDYHETIMAAAGIQAEENLRHDRQGTSPAATSRSSRARSRPAPTARTARSVGARRSTSPREVCGNAAATIAIGTCAAFGGLPAAAPNPTGALGVADAVPGVKNLINLSACPANVENLTALLVYYLTFKRWPPLDQLPPSALRLRQVDSRQLRAPRALRRRTVRRGVGRRGPSRRVLPLQDGVQGTGDVPELPERPVERRHELADRLRPSVHRLRRAGLLGSHDARSTSTCPGIPGFGIGIERRHDRRATPCSVSAPRSPATA